MTASEGIPVSNKSGSFLSLQFYPPGVDATGLCMIKKAVSILLLLSLCAGCQHESSSYRGISDELIHANGDTVLEDSIMFHNLRVDQNGAILPWYSKNLGTSYNHVLMLVWQFWNNMRTDTNGLKYYMNHQVWKADQDDKRGIGGDQISMALSSWNLLYRYTGDASVLKNMRYMADYYLSHSRSSPDCKWPNLPYPYNTDVGSGIYDGDMILGPGYLQPDKAGSFGFELTKLYQVTEDPKYLQAAIKIANTLAHRIRPGDRDHSPWPFKVNARTGKTGILVFQKVWHQDMDKDSSTWQNPQNQESSYTTNWTATLCLFDQLITLRQGETEIYQKAIDMTLDWLKKYPVRNNRWGPFFEDVPGWSDTQINAITYALYILNHPSQDSSWKTTVHGIFEWVHHHLDNQAYRQYGVVPINEQTAYQIPGNSHSSREAAVELMYWEKTGDTTYLKNDIRMLNWATYMVNERGQNQYPQNDIWMTDGYGDYVRHYLRAMAAAPQLAPDDQNHMLRSSAVVQRISYENGKISYSLFGKTSKDVFRLTGKPKEIRVNNQKLSETDDTAIPGWVWQPLKKGGILRINQSMGRVIEILE